MKCPIEIHFISVNMSWEWALFCLKRDQTYMIKLSIIYPIITKCCVSAEKNNVICSVTWRQGYDVTLNEENSQLENVDRLFLKFGAFTSILLWFIDQQIATAPGQAAHFEDRLLTGPHKQKEITLTLDCRYMGRLRRFIWGRDGQSSRTR